MKYQILFKQYVWLVNAIARRGRLSLEEINNLWVETEMSGGEKISRSTFNRHKDAIQDIFGIFIECDRMDAYRYYIDNTEELRGNNIRNWMLSTMTVTNLLSEHKSIHHRVLLEDVPSGECYLDKLMDAMRCDVKVKILYKKYATSEGSERLIAPLCLKLYRCRWYVLAQVEDGDLRLFSLDRIHGIRRTTERFQMPKDFDAEAHFHDVIGVMTGNEQPLQRIVVRAYQNERYYLRDLPLHCSQKQIASTAEYADFEYYLVPTSELETQLLSRGSLEQVLKPQWLAEK